ncbi:hypothetical protein NQ318_005637 [Aromia moschata]|uniref:Pseudouridine synthase I TruA alpha/beta domain-containing protein n=1 Tax=Aromia moschata TaxID=1265417 RepID=A0AAV8XX01_9CUCU|nr:hypothetical protein NQ318_005637 [Aromia moschata]
MENKNQKTFDFSKYSSRHILLKIFYLGWGYQGYVTQEDTTNTIEHHLFEALTKTKLIKDRSSSNYHRCGRTDKGVSAFGQTISIDIRSNLSDNQDDIEKEINYCRVLNRVLPNDIQCIAWASTNNSFSARFDCKSRTYKYFFPKGNLNIENMQFASKKLLGTHDFRNFCKMDVGNGVVEFIRNITSIGIEPVKSYDSENEYALYVISIKGNAFLWHQIRCILGILLLIGQKKEDPSIIDELFNIEKNPRKPEYSMASEIPLNLFFSEYDDLTWHYDKDSLGQVIEKLNNIWTHTAIKQSMIKEMLNNLNENLENINGIQEENKKCLSDCLLQGVKPKKIHSCHEKANV